MHWFFSLSNFVIPRKCLKNFTCAASKRCSSPFFSTQASLPNFNAALAVMLWILNFVSLFSKMSSYSCVYKMSDYYRNEVLIDVFVVKITHVILKQQRSTHSCNCHTERARKAHWPTCPWQQNTSYTDWTPPTTPANMSESARTSCECAGVSSRLVYTKTLQTNMER